MFPNPLHLKLQNRTEKNAFRNLGKNDALVDFSSNDYLGFSKDESIYYKSHQLIIESKTIQNGGTGSRLLSGNHNWYQKFEHVLCESHHCESALVFNSGYTANLGFFSCIPQRGDIIFYDELIHASIRDGLTMSRAKSYKFKHNDLEDLALKLKKLHQKNDQAIYVVTESVFSMDGDCPDLIKLTQLCKENNVYLVVDEAHALGVFGYGLMQKLKLENNCFARIITFGKAIGIHGAAILGSQRLINYLINFSRPFIYTTSMPPHTLASLVVAYEKLNQSENQKKLHQNITYFKSKIKELDFIPSTSAIQCCIINGNDKVKAIAHQLREVGFDVKPILSPTVPEGQERLRFCLHRFNSEKEISEVTSYLKEILQNE